ncbi:MAG TPA: alpha/beta fold hydrolase [Steroidobacteraceae bacterium]|nr:alpha/beta fold hydrolase [Steroidobacteraceae bacterium]
MANRFVLVHGAWHGAWCWHKLIPLLEAAGVRAIAPDLSSVPADSATPLEDCARHVVGLLQREPGSVLVGHSRGGAVISRAAELAPDHVRRLVYVAAYLLADGQSVADAARGDADSLITPNMVPVKRGLSCGIRREVLREVFYADCTDADFEFARARLVPEPIRALAAPIHVTPDRFGRVPRVYVETSRDRAVTLAAQRQMQSALPCTPVHTLDSDHSPFLSQPEALARILISI